MHCKSSSTHIQLNTVQMCTCCHCLLLNITGWRKETSVHGLCGITTFVAGTSFSSWTTGLWICSGTLAQDTGPSICKDEGDASVRITCKLNFTPGRSWAHSDALHNLTRTHVPSTPCTCCMSARGRVSQGCQRTFSYLIVGHDSSPSRSGMCGPDHAATLGEINVTKRLSTRQTLGSMCHQWGNNASHPSLFASTVCSWLPSHCEHAFIKCLLSVCQGIRPLINGTKEKKMNVNEPGLA